MRFSGIVALNSSFCALVGLLLINLNHYFNYSIEINTFFWLRTVTLSHRQSHVVRVKDVIIARARDCQVLLKSYPL